MSQDKERFTDRRWADPPKATVIGQREYSEEEKRANKELLRSILQKNGALKNEE